MTIDGIHLILFVTYTELNVGISICIEKYILVYQLNCLLNLNKICKTLIVYYWWRLVAPCKCVNM